MDVEVVFSTAGFQDLLEADAGGIIVKERETAVAAEGDAVEMPLPLVAFTTPTSHRPGSYKGIDLDPRSGCSSVADPTYD